ncbi:MAG TPA: bifunctional diaminohydroxyphosphoribosylaminopyrimidine deaminase/5-amino-6-(5-phosphoribosylamino)uracil reductase RibD, partial [Polyangiaceae bacterium]|nr:bifunctional diaminohydroxyphosphoribosylaminopyrimidine deaminase/5-amino-6-(5-phosphoribosylamino)uracil reductase RibD [Polyangiaceae bacterium]
DRKKPPASRPPASLGPASVPPPATTPAVNIPAPPTDDERFMDMALAQAKLGRPSPNPHVGAIVVANGQLLSAGYHERVGADHAEVAAIRAAGTKAKGATLYVTLEPCNHHGRTPPCTDAIIAAQLKRVVIGVRDPNPHVEGKGIEKLRAAGIEVVVGVREPGAQKVIAPWQKHITLGMPYVSLKLALSLDGRIATRTGASKWVTGPEARAKVQELRALSDAVAVGIGTALADDPMLTVRDPDFTGTAPRRVIFDSQLRLPLESRLVASASEYPLIVLTTLEAPEDREAALAAHGAEVLRVAATAEGRVDVDSGLRQLAAMGVVSLLVEGGAELAGSVLASRLVQRLHAFVAPILLGPRGRPGAVDWAGPDTPQEAPRIVDPTWELVGRDAYVSGPMVFPERE